MKRKKKFLHRDLNALPTNLMLPKVAERLTRTNQQRNIELNTMAELQINVELPTKASMHIKASLPTKADLRTMAGLLTKV